MNRLGVGVEFGEHREYPVIRVFSGGRDSPEAQQWMRQYPEQIQGIISHPRRRFMADVPHSYSFSAKGSNTAIANELIPL